MELYVYPENLCMDCRNKNPFELKLNDFKPNIQSAMISVWENGGIVRYKDAHARIEVSIIRCQ